MPKVIKKKTKSTTDQTAPKKIHPNDRFIKFSEVMERVGLSRSAIYKLMHKDQFPPRRYVGGTHVVWLDSEITGWMERQAQNTRPYH